MLRIRTKAEAEKRPKEGDIIYIQGWFKKRIAEVINNKEIRIQGWFKIKTKKLKKYNKRRFKVFKNGELYIFPRFI